MGFSFHIDALKATSLLYKSKVTTTTTTTTTTTEEPPIMDEDEVISKNLVM